VANEVNIVVQRFGAVLRGYSAFEIAVQNGFEGTEAEWLEYLRAGVDDGTDGWSPIFAIAADGERRVMRVADWIGGGGTKPPIGQYIGPAGLTAVLADALDVRGTPGAAGAAGTNGTNGTNGWAPLLAVVADGARRVLQVTEWTGGTGTKPTTGHYVGAAGLTSVLAEAIDIRGGTGAAGTNGTNGWAPLLAVVADGARRVLQVTDWTGGSGTKPTAGQYVGAAGLTAVLAEAIDLRGAAGTSGTNGTNGTNGWVPLLAVVADGARRVLQVTDWTGGSGTKPTAGQYIGAAGLTAVLADAIDVRGAAGTNGTNGSNGTNGWAPLLGVVADGARRVLQVTDWTGGSGTKPTTGQYVGAAGLTAVLADAIDIRGTAGTAGTNGTNGASAWTPILAVVTDSARRVLQVTDWTGGSGTKPTTGVYLSATGFTTVLASAVDIRALANTDGLPEGAANKYFTDARAVAALEASNAPLGIFTMATRPPATPANRGRVILVTGIGNVEFVQMISTGSKWVPFGGSQLLYHWTEPSANVTTPGTATAEVTATDRVMTIPAGLATPSSLFEHRSQARWPAAVADNVYRIKSGSASIYVSTTGQLYAHPNTRFWNKGSLTAQRRSGAASGGTGMGHTTSDTYTLDIAIDTGAEWTITPTLAGAASTTAYVEFSDLVWVDA